MRERSDVGPKTPSPPGDPSDPGATESYKRQHDHQTKGGKLERHDPPVVKSVEGLSPAVRKELYWRFDRLGRVRLSQNFIMRQFLLSEIALAYGIVNLPDDETRAIHAGTKLCERILEPIVGLFGPIIIRSGFRSATLNAFGHQHSLACASNEKNFARHIWDHPDKEGRVGASACISIPAFNAGQTELTTRDELAVFLKDRTPCDHITFFKRDNAFNIGWKEPKLHAERGANIVPVV